MLRGAEARRRAGAVVVARETAVWRGTRAVRYVASTTMRRHLRRRCRRAEPGVPAGDRSGARTRRARSASSMSGWGIWRRETDADGRTSVGCGVRRRRRRVARRLARGAGARPAGRPGRGARPRPAAPDEPATRSALATALAFQEALWRLFRPLRAASWLAHRRDHRLSLRGGHGRPAARGTRRRPDVAGGAEEGDARRHGTLPGTLLLRRPSRGSARMRRMTDAFAAPRAPLRPVPAAPLMFEAPEFEAPLLDAPDPPARLHPLPALPDETRHADVLVIGGGLAGLCTAYYLAQGRRGCAAGRARRGRHGGQHRQCRQPARAVAVVRFHRRHAGGWRPGRAHAAAGAASHRAVEADRRRGRREVSASAPRVA